MCVCVCNCDVLPTAPADHTPSISSKRSPAIQLLLFCFYYARKWERDKNKQENWGKTSYGWVIMPRGRNSNSGWWSGHYLAEGSIMPTLSCKHLEYGLEVRNVISLTLPFPFTLGLFVGVLVNSPQWTLLSFTCKISRSYLDAAPLPRAFICIFEPDLHLK